MHKHIRNADFFTDADQVPAATKTVQKLEDAEQYLIRFTDVIGRSFYFRVTQITVDGKHTTLSGTRLNKKLEVVGNGGRRYITTLFNGQPPKGTSVKIL